MVYDVDQVVSKVSILLLGLLKSVVPKKHPSSCKNFKTT